MQVGLDKVHVTGSWQRYTEDGRALVGSAITYIVTNDRGGGASCLVSPPGRQRPTRRFR